MKNHKAKLSAILIAGVLLKMAVEGNIEKLRADSNLGKISFSTEVRAKLGQNLAVALLGGFRGVVADFVWFEVETAYEEQIWYKLKEQAELVVVLQPHCVLFWDMGFWHMAYNASYAESKNFRYPNQAYRLKAQQDWIHAGKEFLERGIQNNPTGYQLYFSLGYLICDRFKFNDPLSSIPYLKKAASDPNAPSYVVRMIGHMYEKGGKKEEAYQWWKQLWLQDHKKNPQQLWDKIAEWGYQSEEKLNIPSSERVFPSKK